VKNLILSRTIVSGAEGNRSREHHNIYGNAKVREGLKRREGRGEAVTTSGNVGGFTD